MDHSIGPGQGIICVTIWKLSTAPNKSFKAEVFKSLNTKSSLYNPFNKLFFEYDWHINSKSHMSFYLSKLK